MDFVPTVYCADARSIKTKINTMEILLEHHGDYTVVKILDKEEDILARLRRELQLLEGNAAGIDHYKFQRWADRWDRYVNITSSSDIEDGDTIKAVCKQTEAEPDKDRSSKVCYSYSLTLLVTYLWPQIAILLATAMPNLLVSGMSQCKSKVSVLKPEEL